MALASRNPRELFYTLVGFSVLFVAWHVYSTARRGVNAVGSAGGSAWSDMAAAANGWEPVELSPLVLTDEMFVRGSYELTPDASRVLWGIEQYRPVMVRAFDGDTLRPEYRAFIGVPLTANLLE